MNIPATLYGTYTEIGDRGRDCLKKIYTGQSLAEAFVANEIINLDGRDFLITTTGHALSSIPARTVCADINFPFEQIALKPPITLSEQAREQLIGRIFEEALTEAWSTLGLCLGQQYPFFYYPGIEKVQRDGYEYPLSKRFRPFLEAVAQYWEEFSALGDHSR